MAPWRPPPSAESGGNGSVAGLARLRRAGHVHGGRDSDRQGRRQRHRDPSGRRDRRGCHRRDGGRHVHVAGRRAARASDGDGTATISSSARVNRGKLTGRVTLKVKVTGRGHDPFVFRSTSITALTGGAGTGTVEGLGTVNDAAGYSFRLTAVDGSPDQVRMQRVADIVGDGRLRRRHAAAADVRDP